MNLYLRNGQFFTQLRKDEQIQNKVHDVLTPTSRKHYLKYALRNTKDALIKRANVFYKLLER